jgi:hypothetical protein
MERDALALELEREGEAKAAAQKTVLAVNEKNVSLNGRVRETEQLLFQAHAKIAELEVGGEGGGDWGTAADRIRALLLCSGASRGIGQALPRIFFDCCE